MSEFLIFGHKSPDTDSICASLVMEKFNKNNGIDAKAVRLGELNKETKYVLEKLGVEAPELIEKVENGQPVILVDHNSFLESVDNIENAKIEMVVDHHKLTGMVTSEPIYYLSEPVGCTCTLMCKKFRQSNMKIEKREAMLMLSAIISDTLLFKSPTCTEYDKMAAKELAKIADINIEEYGMEMLKSGTDLSDVSEKGLIGLDAKEVKIGDLNTIIAQVNTASIPEMMQRKEKIEEEMKKVIEEKGLDLFFFAITDIINSNSQAIVLGNKANIVESAYNVKLENNTAFLEGVVSRKKQIIPVLTKYA